MLARLPVAALVAAALFASSAVAASTSVEVRSFAFAPAEVAIEAGDAVRWTNLDGTAHTATADDGSFDTGRLAQGDARSHTFLAAGRFPYHCAIHPSMTGTVVVRAGAAPADPPRNAAPVAELSVAPETGRVGDLFVLDGSRSKDPDGRIARWVFELGADCGLSSCRVSSEEPTLRHTYSAPGAYVVGLVVRDDAGAESARVTRSLLVHGQVGTPSVDGPDETDGGRTVTVPLPAGAFALVGLVVGGALLRRR